MRVGGEDFLCGKDSCQTILACVVVEDRGMCHAVESEFVANDSTDSAATGDDPLYGATGGS